VSERIDKVMVEKGMVRTRSQARMLIEQGDVYCNDKLVKKAGLKVNLEDHLEIRNRSLFVSRGAYKLEKALVEFEVEPEEKIVADVGASTGGFTQLMLQRGAKKVYAIDVGHDQLAPELMENPNVINLEGTNIKFPLELDELVDICVVDLSFISITQVFKNIDALMKPGGQAVILIKPQFEAGKERLGKNGLVKAELREVILGEVLEWFKENSFRIVKCVESPIHGKTGNVEYLALYQKD
jgi:23S rRNA (cytidine1920-2'-O)/16S rRNA (cytidine1409-2'-O)-methyltransferase